MKKYVFRIAVLSALVLLFTGCLLDVYYNSRRMFKPTEEFVRLLGRTVTQNNIAVLAHAGTGVEFNVKANKLSVTVMKDSMKDVWHGDVRFVAFFDDERVMDVVLTEDIKEFVIFDSPEVKTGVVRIVKATECMMANAAIQRITTDRLGEIHPTEAKKYKIEFIGDSATAGYGVDETNPNVSFKIETEDITKSYAYKCALALDADYSIICGSGWGVCSGYSPVVGVKNTDACVPPLYDKIGFSDLMVGSVNPGKTEWDFNRFKPDIISILLGTNDHNYTQRLLARRNEFKDAYVQFIYDIRAKNPDSYILCCSGIAPDDLDPEIQAAVSEYKAQTGDENVGYLHIPLHDGYVDGFGADYHPTDIAYTKAANYIVPHLKDLLK